MPTQVELCPNFCTLHSLLIHGILPKDQKEIIVVTIDRFNDDIRILIEDTGIGMDQETIRKFVNGNTASNYEGDRAHIGINNIQERIIFLYGTGYGINIESKEGEWTRVILTLPDKADNLKTDYPL